MRDTLLNTNAAQEKIMLLRLLTAAREFYADPKNMQAFEAWKKNKEAEQNAANHVNA